MNKKLTWLGMALTVAIPACCSPSHGIGIPAKNPEVIWEVDNSLTMPEHLEHQTAALVKWIGVTGHDEDGDPIYDEVNPENDPEARLRAFCTAVWVDRDTMLTAEHCVHQLGMPVALDDASKVQQQTMSWDPTGQPLSYAAFGDVRDLKDRHYRTVRKATVLDVDQDNDLALVRATGGDDEELPFHEVAVLATSGHVGDEVHVIGHTAGQWWSYTHGYIAQFRPQTKNHEEKVVDVIQVSAPVWFGNSGGGAFSTDGRLLGVASWISRGVPNMSFFVDYSTCRRFLSKNDIR